MSTPQVAPPGRAYREALELARGAAARAGRETAAELAPDVPAIVHAVVESPVAALVEAPERLDLLVCGSRGYGPLRRVLLSSVSRPLSHMARCPLVVLPRAAARGGLHSRGPAGRGPGGDSLRDIAGTMSPLPG